MKFRIYKYVDSPADIVREEIIRRALFRVNIYRFSKAEKLLDKYFQENENSNLRQACKNLLYRVKILDNSEKTYFIAIFTDKQDDKIASLITYGNSELYGSDILKFALGYIKER